MATVVHADMNTMVQHLTATRLHPVERARPALESVLRALWNIASTRPLMTFATMLLAVDAVFIVIQVAVDVTDYGFNGAYRLSLETEAGIAQFYGWAKLGAAAYLLAGAARRFHSTTAALWAVALAYLGVDDALRVHEGLGSFFAETLNLSDVGPLRGQDLGELLAYALILAVAIAGLVVAEIRERGTIPSVLTMVMVPIVGVFVFFAVVVDTVGRVLPSVIEIAFEDGGELVAMTAMLVTAVVWSYRADELASTATAQSLNR